MRNTSARERETAFHASQDKDNIHRPFPQISGTVADDVKRLRRARGLEGLLCYLSEKSSTIIEASAAVQLLSSLPARPAVAEIMMLSVQIIGEI